jgi:hypothetical protein
MCQAWVLAFCDQSFTNGNLAVAVSILALPILYLRGHLLLLPAMPLMIPLSLIYAGAMGGLSLNEGADDASALAVTSAAGAVTALALGVMSLVKAPLRPSSGREAGFVTSQVSQGS